MRQRCVNPARSYNLRADELKEKVEKENKEKAGSVCLDDTRPSVSPPPPPLTVFPKTVFLGHSSLPGVRKACLCYRVRAGQNTDKPPPGRNNMPEIQDRPYPGRNIVPGIQSTFFRQQSPCTKGTVLFVHSVIVTCLGCGWLVPTMMSVRIRMGRNRPRV